MYFNACYDDVIDICIILYSRVTIKTLKNSVNAVLPDWYPVAPLIKNGDEIFAFRGKKLCQYTTIYTYYSLLGF